MCCAWPNVEHLREAYKDCIKVSLSPSHPPLPSFIHAFICLPPPFNRCKTLMHRGAGDRKCTSTFALRMQNCFKPSKMPIRQGTRFSHNTHHPHTWNDSFHGIQALLFQHPPNLTVIVTQWR